MKTLLKRVISVLIILQTCEAQVPVSEEPRHHKVFEDAYVRVLDVHVVPGDTTLFHKHQLPSVFIVLNNAKTGSETISDGAITNVPVTYGNMWFDGFYTKPRIHRVWNTDTIEFHVMDIELLNETYKEINSPVQQKSIRMLFNEKPVMAYSCLLNSHSNVNFIGRKCPVLIVGLTDNNGEVIINENQFKQKGDFIFIPAGGRNVFINKGTSEAQLAIFELK
jgi:quercetin dioxygenase-like cupin family protein